MAELKEGLLGGAVNLYFIYKFLRILTTPWESTDAFKLGIVNEKGKILKKHRKLKTDEEKDSYTMMHRLVWKLKRLLEKIPFGKSRLASYATALWLIKEEKNFHGTDEELQESVLAFLETDWKNEALILKENYEGDMDKQTYNRMKETWASGFAKKVHADTKKQARKEKLARMKKKKGEEVEEARKKKVKLPPHLAKFFDKKGNPKPEVAARIRKARALKGVKITDVTPDWMFGEEVEEGYQEIQNLANLIKSETDRLVKAAKKGDMKTVMAIYRTIGNIIK